MSKAVTTKTSTTDLGASAFGGGALQVEGQDDNKMQLGRVVLFQGTAEEEEMYGEHKRGTFLDALEQRELGDEIDIMPVRAWASWAKFNRGENRPEYSTTIKAEVPDGDLEWGEDGTPPAASESVNCVVVVKGEPWPYLLIFKRTGLAAFNKTIKPVEARRGATGKTPGLYRLTSTDDKSADGKPFKRLVCRALRDPDTDTAKLAKTVFDAMDQAQAQQHAEAVSQDNPFAGEDGDDIPI